MPYVSPQVAPGRHSHRTGRRLFLALLGVVAGWLFGGCASSSRNTDASRSAVFYPAAPSTPRIAYLADISDLHFSSKQPSALEHFLFGPREATGGLISKPFGLAFADGELLVCDTKQRIVHVFDLASGQYAALGDSGLGRLSRPVAIALDDAGTRYVADIGRGEIIAFSRANEALRALRPPGDSPFEPVAVACYEGRLYVADRASRRVLVIDPSQGHVVRTLGSRDTESSSGLPSGLAMDPHGGVWVSDVLHARISHFSERGEWLGSIGHPGDRAGCLARPKHLAVASDGILYVVDAAFQRVQMFDESGQSLMLFGGPGSAPGCLTMPAGIAVDASAVPLLADRIPSGFDARYIIFVSDQFGPWRIRIYAFGEASRR